MTSGHTHFPTGARVFVKLHDGTTFVDRFVERHSRSVELRGRGRVRTEDIASIGFAKARGSAPSRRGP